MERWGRREGGSCTQADIPKPVRLILKPVRLILIKWIQRSHRLGPAGQVR